MSAEPLLAAQEDPSREIEGPIASPYALLRFAALPVGRLLELRCGETAARVAGLRELEGELRRSAETLSGALHALAPTLDAPARHALLELRRAVFALRAPRGGWRKLRRLRPALPRTLRGELLRFARRHLRWRRESAALGPAFERELSARRARLRELLLGEDFLAGLSLASAEFHRVLAAYLSRAEPDLRVETTAMLYLGRMGAKTSPFAGFTPTALGRVVPGQASFQTRLAGRPRRRVRFNSALAHLIARHLLARPELRASRELCLRQGSWVEDGQRRHLRSRYKERPLFGRHDTLARLPLLPAVEGLLDTLRVLGGRASQARLVERLVRDGARSSAAEAAIEKLLEAGLLDVVRPLGPHEQQPLAALAAWLERQEVGLSSTAAALRDAQAALERCAQGPAAAAELGAALRLVTDSLGLPPEALAGLDPVREDAALPGITWRLSDAALDLLLSDLGPLAAALGFGRNQQAAALLQAFKARYGTGGRTSNALAFLAAFGDELLERQARGQAPPLAQVLPASAAARRTLARLVELVRAAPGDAEEVVVDPGRLRPADDGGLRGGPASLTAFVQVAGTPQELARGEGLLVLNALQGGHGAYAARFCGLFGDEGCDPLAELLQGQLAWWAGAAEPVDLPFGCDSSDVQVHPRLTARDWAWPGEARDPGALGLEDVELRHDPASDQLRLHDARDGRELMPFYLGGLHPHAFPHPGPVFLDNVTPTCHSGLRDFWRQHREAWQRGREEAPVQRLPRVRVGRLVLARAAWRVAVEALPRPARGERLEDYFLRVQSWRLDQGLPEVVFARAELHSFESLLEHRNKPVYVDFLNPWCVFALPRLLSGEVRHLLLSEMLPGPGQLAATWQAEPVASELQVEINWRPA